MSNRANWMNSLVAKAFGVSEHVSNCVFIGQGKREYFDNWMDGQGPPHMFIYYQAQYKITDQGEIKDQYSNASPEFFVTDGEKLKLRGKGVYFLRTTKPGQPINSQG